jgi:hypothetical protein
MPDPRRANRIKRVLAVTVRCGFLVGTEGRHGRARPLVLPDGDVLTRVVNAAARVVATTAKEVTSS